MDFNEGKYESKAGLTVANRLADKKTKEKVIIYGLDNIQKFWLDTEFRRFMSHNNTEYIKAPFSLEDLQRLYSRKKFENPALSAVADIGYKQNIIGKLKHDYHHIPLREDVLRKAREELGMSGDNEEIKEKLFAYVPEQKIKPQFFPGVFCDVEGTLISEGELNDGLVKELTSYSKEKSVNIWTGSDLKYIGSLLMNYNLEYPLLSKDWFRGCEVELAIDDLERKEFEKMYEIKAKKFRKV